MRRNMFGINEKFIEVLIEEHGEDPQNQLDILQEECAELIQAISKYRRGKIDAREKIIEEMSHVIFSASTSAKLLCITQEDIRKEEHRKAASCGVNLDGDYEYVIGIYYPSSYQRLARFVERLRYDLFLSGIDTNIIDNNKTLATDKGKIIFVRDPRFIAGTRYSKYFEFPDDMKDEFIFRESDEKPFDGSYKDYILMKEGISDEEG